MGNKSSAEKNTFLPEYEVSLSMKDFKVVRRIGHGAFGEVIQVQKKDTGVMYAMKKLKKSEIVETDAVEQSKAEESIQRLAGEHRFIVNLRFAFQDKNFLYIVLDYVSGGDLFYHIQQQRRFPLDRVRLYAAEVYLALDYVHSSNIIYRDLKLENVLLDATGHVRLTDFGLAKAVISVEDQTWTFCGTKEYMAPEVIDTSIPYGKAVDWWTYGVLVYAMLVGKYPFYAKNKAALFDKVLNDPVEFPPYLNEVVCDFIEKLLIKDPLQRLGGKDVMKHPFFDGLDWDRVARRGYEPDFIPDTDGNDTFTSTTSFYEGAKQHSLDHQEVDDSGGDLFRGFSFSASERVPVPAPATSFAGIAAKTVSSDDDDDYNTTDDTSDSDDDRPTGGAKGKGADKGKKVRTRVRRRKKSSGSTSSESSSPVSVS